MFNSTNGDEVNTVLRLDKAGEYVSCIGLLHSSFEMVSLLCESEAEAKARKLILKMLSGRLTGPNYQRGGASR